MKTTVLAAIFLLLSAGTAAARDTGIINQIGPYEATMRFYLHPAHGFPGKPEAAEQAATASASDRAATKESDNVVALRSHDRALPKTPDAEPRTGGKQAR